ncbi:LacI family DNA-binding transcriptional regulator [Sanguibacter antarcticus]|uniref:LacI family transcriptional regulator n=1 Tax=Sanguibacter antarcticus TaxID=372484 RepID=A0A2A9E358_9MICO|nr:LacI family DNA-binding transcriptional regulator [Sanguibacter antarcticus]PFG33011.1 LacI family transcriptional regulator [Sanguibacter antarcticus]
MPAAQSTRRATLSDVARAAGVSVPTVSKVVKGRTDVAPKTRARILALLDEHGYSPRGTAPRDLPRVIELCFDSMESTNNLATMRGVLKAAEPLDVDVIVKITPREIDGATWVARVTDTQHSGIILVTSQLPEDQREQFSRAGVPIVVIDPINSPADALPSVGVNNFTGGYLATKHLIDLGHTRIAIIQGTASECSHARLAGYHAAIREADITPVDEYEEHGAFRFQDGERAAERLFDLPQPPTAIFAANDLEALGVFEAARKRGIPIPHELSVVGFDDSLQAASASPRLTTVRQPFAEIGSTALQVLLQLAEGTPLATQRLELTTHLIVRESTTTPPAP